MTTIMVALEHAEVLYGRGIRRIELLRNSWLVGCGGEIHALNDDTLEPMCHQRCTEWHEQMKKPLDYHSQTAQFDAEFLRIVAIQPPMNWEERRALAKRYNFHRLYSGPFPFSWLTP